MFLACATLGVLDVFGRLGLRLAAQKIIVESDEAQGKRLLRDLGFVVWYTLETGVTKEQGQNKAYGGAILSSAGEIQHAFGESSTAQFKPFVAAEVLETRFTDQKYQPIYFVATPHEAWGAAVQYWKETNAVMYQLVEPLQKYLADFFDRKNGFRRADWESQAVLGTAPEKPVHIFCLVEEAPSSWPADALLLNDSVKSLQDKLSQLRKEEIIPPYILNIAQKQDTDVKGDVYIYLANGQAQRFNGSPEGHNAAIDFLKNGPSSLASDMEDMGTNIFVCAHKAKDRRCGTCGPALCDAFGKILTSESFRSSDVKVRPCSHFGGHKFAGCIVLYGPPDLREWFGYVQPSTCARLLKAAEAVGAGGSGGGEARDRLLRDPELRRLWRGSLKQSRQESEKTLKNLEMEMKQNEITWPSGTWTIAAVALILVVLIHQSKMSK